MSDVKPVRLTDLEKRILTSLDLGNLATDAARPGETYNDFLTACRNLRTQGFVCPKDHLVSITTAGRLALADAETPPSEGGREVGHG